MVAYRSPRSQAADPAAQAQVQHFFELLYPGVGEGYLVLSWPSPTRRHKDGRQALDSSWHNLATTSLARFAARVQALSTEYSVYFGVLIQHPRRQPNPFQRSQNASAYVLPALYCDIDLASGAHAASTLPATETEALQFLQDLPSKPSLILHTGGGVHGYWLFESPVWLHTEADRLAMAQLLRQFASTLCQRGTLQGWTLDALADLARVLRPPGTINHKYGTPVQVLEERPVRYAVADFDWLTPLPAPKVPRRRPASSGPQARDTGLRTKPDLTAVVEAYGCTLTQKSDQEWHGAHPQHGSSTGTNLDVNPALQLWHCWRHDSGGDAFDMIAVCSGLLQCEACHRDHPKGYRFPQVLDIAQAQFGWRPPPAPRSPFPTFASRFSRGLSSTLRSTL